jgi:hypothetical protein
LGDLLETSGNDLDQQTAWMETFTEFTWEHGCAAAFPPRPEPGAIRRVKEF